MPPTKAMESPVQSDDDSISLTSTAPTEPKDEYPIEGILAERLLDGTTTYLVKWEGYPDERCTWEPKPSFQDGQTFHDWQNRKMHISRGLYSPYNVEALETRVENWIEATEKRKARRRAKRIRLGLAVDLETEGDGNDNTANKELVEDSSDSDEPLRNRTGSFASANHGTDARDGSVLRCSNFNVRLKRSQKWTAKEEAALIKGLELVNGPFWDSILGFYGPTGTISQDLKEKDALDLEAKSLKLKIDYVKSGRDVPEYLRLANHEITNKRAGKIQTVNRAREDKDSSSTEDSLMGDLQHAAVKHTQNHIRKQSETLSGAKRSKPPDQGPKGIEFNLKSGVGDPPAVPKPKVSVAQMIPRVGPPKKATSNRGESQMGSVGTGPLRLGVGDRELKSASKRQTVSGAAILGNWNASMRPRRKQLPLQNAASVVEQQSGRFNKLSRKRRYEKASRNERAPDINSLTLMNPKDLSIVKKPFVLSPVITEPTRKSTVSHQEYPVKRKDEATLLGTSTPTSTLDIAEGLSNVVDEGGHDFQVADQKTRQLYTAAPPNRGITTSSVPQFPVPFIAGGSRPLEYPAFKDFDKHQVIGTIKLGLDFEDLGSVRFRGIDPFVKRLLLGLKSGPRDLSVWLKHSVLAADYEGYFQTDSNEFSGYIAPYPQTEWELHKMAETLKVHVSGALLLSNEFSMLVYPSGSEDWSFLDDKLPACPPETVLRFVIRQPLPELMKEEPQKPLSGSTDEPDKRSPGLAEDEPIDITAVRSTVSIRDGEGNINSVFREVYNVEYSRLVAPTTLAKTTEMHSFFLIFPPSKEAERDLLVQFLEHNKANDTFDNETSGAWDYFSNHVDAGVIIIHEDFFNLWRIPYLARVLRKNINVWNFNLTPSPLNPDPHLNRLFPHGAALLLTDGLFLHRPHEAARILSWFRLIILNSKAPRAWKLCTRPRLREWLLAIQEHRNMEDGKVYVQCYGEVWRMLKDEYMEECIEDEEQPTEDAPMCFMGEVSAFDESVGKGVATNVEVDKEAIARNDQVLLEWFAGYAMTKVDQFRRFDIVTGLLPSDERHQEVRDRYQAKWSHVEVVSVEDLYRKHKVPEWEVLDREEEKRVGAMRKRWAEEDAAAEKAKRVRGWGRRVGIGGGKGKDGGERRAQEGEV